jgi:sporulation protein YlmC with PRC-barrel domain
VLILNDEIYLDTIPPEHSEDRWVWKEPVYLNSEEPTMKALTAASLAVLLSTSAYAQQAPGTGVAQPSHDTTQNTTSAPSANRFTINQAPGQWLVGNLWDKSVYNAAGKSIGELKDVLIDKDGKVTALVIGVGGFLGLGEKNVAVDYNYLQKNGSITPDRVTLGMSEEDLRNAPKFERNSSSANR